MYHYLTMPWNLRRLTPLLLLIASPLCLSANGVRTVNPNDGIYKMPPTELQAIVDAPRGPHFKLGPQRKTALLMSLPGLPGIAEVAQPELRLAGLRINPRTRAASQFEFGNGLSILDVATGRTVAVSGLPKNPRIADTAWSPDEQWVAFSCWVEGGVELWLLDVNKARAHRVIADKLNATINPGFEWSAGSEQLFVHLLPLHQKPLPPAPFIPDGPNTLETKGGKITQNRTYPDMLKTPADSAVLDWELQTQLGFVNTKGELHRLSPVLTLNKAQVSPDGKMILTSQLRRPYSTMLPMERFGQIIELWDRQGKK